MKIIGIADGSYTSKKDGQKKEGYRLYLAGPRETVNGQYCEQAWVRSTVFTPFLSQFRSIDEVIGKEVVLNYDRLQTVQSVQLVGK